MLAKTAGKLSWPTKPGLLLALLAMQPAQAGGSGSSYKLVVIDESEHPYWHGLYNRPWPTLLVLSLVNIIRIHLWMCLYRKVEIIEAMLKYWGLALTSAPVLAAWAFGATQGRTRTASSPAGHH